jgi:hypothetical protein
VFIFGCLVINFYEEQSYLNYKKDSFEGNLYDLFTVRQVENVLFTLRSDLIDVDNSFKSKKKVGKLDVLRYTTLRSKLEGFISWTNEYMEWIRVYLKDL